MSAVSYTPIDADRKEVRLLKLEQGDLTTQPRCSLHIATLIEPPDFCALSYVWGTDEELKEIRLEGDSFCVKPNLEEALRYLQCIKDLSLIWVDAICINQGDASEKGQQIGLMPDIYSKARVTYMWVGPPVYYSDVAMALVRESKSIPERTWDNRTTFSLRQLTERAYWTRIWVIQEVFYSNHAVIKCGHDEADFDCVYDLIESMDQRMQRPRTDKCPSDPESNIIKFTKPFPFKLLLKLCSRDRPKGTSIEIDLFRWLNYASNFAATQPRDHIYALLNLSFITARHSIPLDYAVTTSERQIFARAAAYLVRSRSPTKYLLPLQLRQVGKRLDLPSWVPDFSIPSHDSRIVPKPYGKEYCAGQSEEVWNRLVPNRNPLDRDIRHNPVQFRFSEDFQTLIIRGLKIDKVLFAVSIADGDQLARQPDFNKKQRTVLQREVLDAYSKWRAMALSTPRNAYQSKEGLLEALWRTMMGDQCGKEAFRNPPSAQYGICFEEWKDLVMKGSKDIDDPTLRSPTLIDFDFRVTTFGHLRAYCCTENGYVGAIHPSAKEGDCVFVFEDGRIPFVLRPQGNKWSWLGEAYIHGVMYGEALESAIPEDVAMLEVQ